MDAQYLTTTTYIKNRCARRMFNDTLVNLSMYINIVIMYWHSTSFQKRSCQYVPFPVWNLIQSLYQKNWVKHVLHKDGSKWPSNSSPQTVSYPILEKNSQERYFPLTGQARSIRLRFSWTSYQHFITKIWQSYSYLSFHFLNGSSYYLSLLLLSFLR